MEKLYYTRRGADRLRNEIAEIKDKLKQYGKRKGQTLDQGETWHDNAEFEEIVRQERMLSERAKELMEKLGRMVLVENPPPNCDKVRLGHVVKLLINGENKMIQIAGCDESEPDAVPALISYQAPLARAIMGKEVGDKARINIGGNLLELEIEEITLPEVEAT
jgi:transcription elongation factor GreA